MRFTISGGSVTFGGNVVLKDINFEIKDRERIALVGRNGSGKSTLLKLIASDPAVLEAFDGERGGFSPDTEIGYSAQMNLSDGSTTLEAELQKAFERLLRQKGEMDRLLLEIERGGSPELSERYTQIENDFRINGGYCIKKEYETVLKSFGFTEADKHKSLNEFSGGQRTRIAFVKLLLSKPDILLLDEPTNHLDAETVEWLEGYLASYPKAMVIVSHDRMFLDRVASVVYDIEDGRLTRYVGSYSDFRKLKEEQYERRLKEYKAQEKEIKKEKELIERFRYKATKASMVQSRIKALERRTLIPPPKRIDLKSFYADLTPTVRSGSEVLRCDGLVIGYDRPLATVGFSLMRGAKLGVIGANGTGKTTLLKTLVGKLPRLGGQMTFGSGVKVGYFDQQLAELSGGESVLENYREEFPSLTETQARNDLGAFLFSGDDCFKPVNVLSGGERVRLSLCKIFRKKPNLLILDEPTNHTDIVGKEALEEMLGAFEGTVVVVSHDRYFISALCDSILFFGDNEAVFYDCGYGRFCQLRALQGDREETPPPVNEDPGKQKKKRFSPLKEYTKIKNRRLKTEEKIALAEEEISGITAELGYGENAVDYLRLVELTNEIEEKKIALSALMEEWEELSRLEEDLQKQL